MGYTVGLCLKNKDNVKPIADYFSNYPLFEILVEVHDNQEDLLLAPDISIHYGPGSFRPPENHKFSLPEPTREMFDRLLAYIAYTYGKIFVVPDSKETTPFWLYDGSISALNNVSCDGDTFIYNEDKTLKKLTKQEEYYYFEEGNEDELDDFFFVNVISEVDAKIDKKVISDFISYEEKVGLIKN